jgi:hypothetical protein
MGVKMARHGQQCWIAWFRRAQSSPSRVSAMSVMTGEIQHPFYLFLTATRVWNWPFEVCFQDIRKQDIQNILKHTFVRNLVKNALDMWCQLPKPSHSDTQITWWIKWGWVQCMLQIAFKMLTLIPFGEVYRDWMRKIHSCQVMGFHLQHKWKGEQYVCTGANCGMAGGGRKHRGCHVNINLNLPSQAQTLIGNRALLCLVWHGFWKGIGMRMLPSQLLSWCVGLEILRLWSCQQYKQDSDKTGTSPTCHSMQGNQTLFNQSCSGVPAAFGKMCSTHVGMVVLSFGSGTKRISAVSSRIRCIPTTNLSVYYRCTRTTSFQHALIMSNTMIQWYNKASCCKKATAGGAPKKQTTLSTKWGSWSRQIIYCMFRLWPTRTQKKNMQKPSWDVVSAQEK